MIEYTSRAGALSRTVTLRLHDGVLERLDQNQKVMRRIEVQHIRKIQQYDGIITRDPETGIFRSEFCKLVSSCGRPIYLRNGMYLRPASKMTEFATNQTAQYDAFLAELKRAVAVASPHASVVHGWLLASLAWWFCALVGCGFLVLGIAVFFTDELLTALLLALFCIGAGGCLAYLGFTLGASYWPRSVSIQEDVKSLSCESI